MEGPNKSLFTQLLQPVLDFFLPISCLRCKKDAAQYLCAPCCAALARPPIWCREKLPGLDGIISAQRHDIPAIADAIHALKYAGVTSLVDQLAQLARPALDEILSHHRRILLIPVPLHPRRERERGFNQSALIAEALVRHCEGTPEAIQKGHRPPGLLRFARNDDAASNPPLLHRNRYTRPQVELSGEQRARNLTGAFRAAQPTALPDLRGITCILVDDVLTTGATLRHCAQALLPLRPAHVYGLTVATAKA